MPGQLAGITVLDLASVGPAARASRWLADFGARVIKVAPVPARAAGQLTPPSHAYSGGRGTERLLVDLKCDAGREVFLRLTESADVVIESFRPGVSARLGISYDDVKSRNPAIVFCATTGYGQLGPRSGWTGHDLNYLAVSGYLAAGERAADAKPALPGTSVADSAAGGLHAVAAILAALLSRGHSGEGCYLDVSVTDGMLALMSLQIDDYLATGELRQPGASPLADRYACYDLYQTADAGWLSVAAIEPRFWANLCRALGLDALVAAQYDPARQEEIRTALADVLRTRDRDVWVDRLAGADTCVAPVLSIPEVAAGTELARVAGMDRSQLPPLLAGAERRSSYLLPAVGSSDTDSVLRSAGFSDPELGELHSSGVIA